MWSRIAGLRTSLPAATIARVRPPVTYVNNAARFADQPVDPNGTGTPGRLLNFDPSGASQVVSLPVRTLRQIEGTPFWRFLVQLYWDQPFDNSASSLQVCLADKNGKPFKVVIDGESYPNCTDASVIGQQAITWATLLGSEAEATLQVRLLDGAAPQRLRLRTSRVVIGQFGTADAVINGHRLSPNAFTTGAANYLATPMCDSTLKTAQLESFSSHGGGLVLFDNDGRALARPVLDGKPDIVGPDGASSVFFGRQAKDGDRGFGVYNLNCRYYPAYPYQFLGTSAAAPHVAAVAALMRQAVPRATPAQLYDALRKTAVDMGRPAATTPPAPASSSPNAPCVNWSGRHSASLALSPRRDNERVHPASGRRVSRLDRPGVSASGQPTGPDIAGVGIPPRPSLTRALLTQPDGRGSRAPTTGVNVSPNKNACFGTDRPIDLKVFFWIA